MRKDDRKAFVEVVVGFAELKGRQLSAPAIELFWNAMQGWTIEEFRAAANVLIQRCEFMPTPKDFNDLRAAAKPTAGEAWSLALEHMRRGTYRWDSGPPTWNEQAPKLDPAIERAVRALGGWRALAMMPVDQLHWQEKRFAEHYAEMAEAVATREALGFQPVDDLSRLLRGKPSSKGLTKL